ncbi:MAG: right-handed parallel beta-helix repeat-containing protein [Aigarchaeota archaeon]|nr:right-handed parallel beta-helix repeat-containing protein [Aigarchaeota archaeon]MCX8192761.1 right-handed parallel beta-helix repeat-containing protein [Nitrososphaeria archaeon]MDW7986008.1 NosD domain-containing protein [Nitrososphaerota archaeon]
MIKKSYTILIVTLILMSIITICSSYNLERRNYIDYVIIVPDDYRSIQEAIKSADVNDIIYVRKGVYNESIIIDKTLWLIGEDPSKVVINGGGNDFTVIIKAEEVLFTRFTITGGGIKRGLIGKGIGLELNKANRSRILNNIIRENRMGIYLHRTSDVILANNIVIENREGIYLYDSTSNRIENNIISDNEYFAVQLFSSTLNKLVNNIIHRNSLGIYLYRYSSGNEIKHNEVREGGIFIVESMNNIISDNTLEDRGLYVTSLNNVIENNTLNGMRLVYLQEKSNKVIEDAGQVILFKCSNITLKNLKIRRAGVAVMLWDTNSSKIINGVFVENEIGIYLHNSFNNNILDSILFKNIIGIRTYKLENSVINGNEITNNRYGIVLEESHNNQVSKNVLAFNTNYGILILYSSKNEIYNNEFYNNSFNIFFYDLPN